MMLLLYRRVRGFYQAFVEKMLKKFPFKDQTLKDLLVLNPEKKLFISTTAGMYISHHVFPLFTLMHIHLFIHTVIRLAERFSIPPEDELDNLEAEFMDYLVSNDLPSYENGVTRLDMWWANVGPMKTNTDQLQFPNLFVPMQCLLILHHSTAKVEGVFSLISL